MDEDPPPPHPEDRAAPPSPDGEPDGKPNGAPPYVDLDVDDDDNDDDFAFTFQKYLSDSAKSASAVHKPHHPCRVPGSKLTLHAQTALSDDMADDESLTESVFNYPKENGRTYHAYRAGSYFFPNDQIEIERLDSQHVTIKRSMDGRNYMAPWTQSAPPHKILDVATGTGTWAVEMGDEFPTAQVIGIDLSPIQPTLVPPNVSFFVEDATEEWHEDNIDYVHARLTMGCWTDMYTEVVDKAFRKLRPGGWFEAQELMDYCHSDDGTLDLNSPFSQWCKDIVRAGELAGRPLISPGKLKEWLVKAGFVDVQEQLFKLPVNGWPTDPKLKEVGKMWHENLQSGLQAYSYGLMHRVLGRTQEEIEVSLVNVRKDIGDPNKHIYSYFFVVWGRKPEVGEVVH